MLKQTVISSYIEKISDKNKNLPENNKIPNFVNGRVDLNHDNIIDLLTPKLKIPEDLRTFLQSNYQNLN